MKIYQKGLSDVLFAKLGGTSSVPSYDNETKKHIAGAMEFTADLSSATTKIAADNDAAYISMKAPYEGTGTLKFTGMSEADIAYLTSAIQSTEGVLGFGEDIESPKLGMKLRQIQVVDGASYVTDYMFHRVVCGYPTIGAKSIDENGNEIADCTVSLDIYGLPYVVNGLNKTRTYSKVSSKTSLDKFNELKDVCFTPVEADKPVSRCATTFAIKDTSGAVSGATLVVKNANGEILTATNGQTYSLAAGKYTYDVSKTGYISQENVALEISSEDVTTGTKQVEVTIVAE